jgi:adenosylhomocysteine nucleosidase
MGSHCLILPRQGTISVLKIAIFSALPDEIQPLVTSLDHAKHSQVNIAGYTFNQYQTNNAEYLITTTGVGTAFAAIITTLVIQHFHPDYIFFIGTAGSVNTDLSIRDVVIARHAFEPELLMVRKAILGTPFENCFHHQIKQEVSPELYSADKDLLAIAEQTLADQPHVHIGTIASSNAFPAPLECYDTIKQAHTLAIDMETSAFYQAAWFLNVPALAVRGISNSLNDDGTDDEVHNADTHGSISAATECLIKIIGTLTTKRTFAWNSDIKY